MLESTTMLTWGVAAASLLLVVGLLASGRKGSVDRRLENLGPGGAAGRLDVSTDARSLRAAGLVAQENPIQELLNRRMRREERKNDLKQRLIQAGIYGAGLGRVFFVLRTGLLVLPMVAGFLAARVGYCTLVQGVLFGLMAGLAGTLAPGMWLDQQKAARQNQLRRSLPDALDVIVVCLQGGLSLTGSLARVARELAMAHPLLAIELSIVERQVQMGRSAGEAMRDFANRFDLEELRSMASVVVQAERMGSSIVTALEVFADTLRVKRYQRAEEQGHKASVKMLFPTLLFIFPAIFIVILGPAAIQVYQQLIQGVLRGQ